MATRDTVRRLIRLTEAEMPDVDLDGFLADNGDSPRLAAADALEAFAGSLITTVSSDDISIDGSKRASILMARAKSLREQAEALGEGPDDDFFFDVVYPHGSRPELTERGRW